MDVPKQKTVSETKTLGFRVVLAASLVIIAKTVVDESPKSRGPLTRFVG
jgi:hypothetical protein